MLRLGAQRARLFAWCAGVRQYQHRAEEAVNWCWQAITEAEQTGARDALAQAYFILDWAYLKLGRLEDAVYSPRAIEIYEEMGDLDRARVRAHQHRLAGPRWRALGRGHRAPRARTSSLGEDRRPRVGVRCRVQHRRSPHRAGKD